MVRRQPTPFVTESSTSVMSDQISYKSHDYYLVEFENMILATIWLELMIENGNEEMLCGIVRKGLSR